MAKKNVEFGVWMHQLDIDYLRENELKIKGVLSELSFLPDNSFMAVGGIMFALSLDDEQKIKMANMWGKEMVEGAKKRLPHLKYLKDDYISKKSLEINAYHLESLISMTEKQATKKIKKYINEKTYVDIEGFY